MIASLSKPVLERILLNSALNIFGDSNDTLEDKIDSAIKWGLLTEGLLRWRNYEISKLPKQILKKTFLQRMRARMMMVSRFAAKALPWWVGAALGTGALNIGARSAETLGLITPEQEQLALDFTHQAEYVLTLGSSGTSPTQFGDEWLNVAKLLISPIADRYDPVVGWLLPGVRDQDRQSLMPYV